MKTMKALSVRQPWAWLIVNGWKNIENRVWYGSFRGRVLIHASQGMTREEYEACLLFVAGFAPTLEKKIPTSDMLERGGIVGSAVILDCVKSHDSEWFCGPYGFVLDEQATLPFFPCRGALGFFSVDMPCMPNTEHQARCPSCLRDLPESWKGRCFLCEDSAKERENTRLDRQEEAR